MTSLRIFSRLIIVLRGDDDYFTKRLIISCVEICSKPMAILMYDDLCVCVCARACICVCFTYIFAMFVLARRRGYLGGILFF